MPKHFDVLRKSTIRGAEQWLRYLKKKNSSVFAGEWVKTVLTSLLWVVSISLCPLKCVLAIIDLYGRCQLVITRTLRYNHEIGITIFPRYRAYSLDTLTKALLDYPVQRLKSVRELLCLYGVLEHG